MERVFQIALVILWAALIIGLAFMTSGCVDYEIERHAVGEPEVLEREVSCTHPGFCSCCKPVFSVNNGIDMHCGFGSCPNCSGRQLAMVEVADVLVTYKSGKTRETTDERIVRRLSECK